MRKTGRAPSEAETPATLGITVLTSMDDETLAATGVTRPLTEQVRALAGQAREAGIAGVVASPQEASMLARSSARCVHRHAGRAPAGAALGDQSRVATPEQAFAAGASHIVIGRPITQADDPLPLSKPSQSSSIRRGFVGVMLIFPVQR